MAAGCSLMVKVILLSCHSLPDNSEFASRTSEKKFHIILIGIRVLVWHSRHALNLGTFMQALKTYTSKLRISFISLQRNKKKLRTRRNEEADWYLMYLKYLWIYFLKNQFHMCFVLIILWSMALNYHVNKFSRCNARAQPTNGQIKFFYVMMTMMICWVLR